MVGSLKKGLSNFLKSFDILQVHGARFNPSTQDSVERCNGTFETVLK